MTTTDTIDTFIEGLASRPAPPESLPQAGIYGFQTRDRDEATAALLVYVVWRSRDTARYKIMPDVWSQVERFVKASAKRSRDIGDWLESMKPRLYAGTLSPRAMEVGIKGAVPMLSLGGGAVLEVEAPEDRREFLMGVISRANEQVVIGHLYNHTSKIVLLVRTRLENEKPLESKVAKLIEQEDD